MVFLREPMSPSPAYILAGGKSSRFGSDKARAVLGGSPLVVRIAEILRGVCGDVTVVADVAEKYVDLGLTTIADRRRNCGPLAGVEAALNDRIERFGSGWIMLASCDLAGLKRDWVARLNDELVSEPVPPGAVAFRDSFWQPFPAAFHTGLIPVLEELLESGRASFQKLLSDSRTSTRALSLPADWPSIVQVNTQEELDRIRDQS